MTPSHLHSTSKAVYPHQADPLELPPLPKHPDAAPLPASHLALIAKWRNRFSLGLHRPNPVSWIHSLVPYETTNPLVDDF